MPKSTSQISPRRTSGFTGRLSVIAQPMGPAVALFLVEHLKKCGRRGTEESALIQTLNQLGLLLSREAFDGGFDFGNRARAVTITGTSIARKSEAKRQIPDRRLGQRREEFCQKSLTDPSPLFVLNRAARSDRPPLAAKEAGHSCPAIRSEQGGQE